MNTGISSRGSSEMTAIQKVEGDDDILMVLLVRLPARSIFRFLRVCRRWKSIISDPFFYQTYYTLRKLRSPQMVAYIQETFSNTPSNRHYRRAPNSITVAPVARGLGIMKSSTISSTNTVFVNSSNGLILLQRGLYQLIIYNPTTKRHISVIQPLSPTYYFTPVVALVYEVNMRDLVPNYKLVVAGKEEGHSYLTLNTFCSMTGTWTTSTPINRESFDDQIGLHSCSPLVVDGVIYWFTHERLYLVVCYVESRGVQLVALPSECRKNDCLKVARSSGEDELQLCMHMPDSLEIIIWTMSREEFDSYRPRSSRIPSQAWKLMHLILLYPDPIPIEPGSDRTTFYNWCFNRGGTEKTTYVAFMMPTQQTLRILNFAEMTFQTVFLGLSSHSQNSSVRCDYSPYMEPLSLSSYAL